MVSRLLAPILLCFASLEALASPFKRTASFDGQYIQPSSSNEAVEWWWGQAIAQPVGSNPPAAFQFLFYQGYPVSVGPRDPSMPEYYIVINGFFPNGTAFATTIPATSGNVSTNGQEVTGTWANAGSFQGSPDLSTFTVNINAPSAGMQGTVTLTSNNANHFGCNSSSNPYFSSVIPSGTELSDSETILFTQLGWATTIPGGNSSVNMMINGTRLQFTGQGYHDANWSPKPLNAAVSSWYFGSAQVGPYDLSYTSVTPVNSTKILNTGYLSRNGVVLQNQCSLEGSKTSDHSTITPYGLAIDTIAGGIAIPTGFIIEYILANGEIYRFNLSSVNSAQNPDTVAYHRWNGMASGGRINDSTIYSGLTVFEWLNPGLLAYTPTSL